MSQKYPAPLLPQSEAAMSYDDIAARLGISRQRVQFIERRALAKLRTKLADLAPDKHDQNRGSA